jgi:glucose/arabinose dehydrogenase
VRAINKGNYMSLSGIFARIVALIGAAAVLWRRLQGVPHEPAWGSAPVVPAAKPQGSIPTLKMPTARGWTDGQTPVAASGLKVNAFATGLKHPRWVHVLPNGDVLVAEATQVPGPVGSVFGYAMQATMRRAAALGVSANRITLLRDTDRDGIAERREIFMEGLNQPFGMALLGDTFYVGNTDGVVAFTYAAGADRITAPGRKLTGFKPGGHWTRSLLPSPDGQKLFVGVGSLGISPRAAWP